MNSNKQLYIPWFANSNDRIHQNYIPDSKIIQTNFRSFSISAIKKYIEKYWKDGVFEKLKTFYPDTTKEVFDKIFPDNTHFLWFTRNIETTINLTSKIIAEELKDNSSISLYCHSQWWLIGMKSILKNPWFLDKINHIELLAPVKNYNIWKNFHQTDNSYLHGKNLIVTKDYISSLYKDNDILIDFLELLKQRNYKGSISLVLGNQDTIISPKLFNLKSLQTNYPFLSIVIKDWNHYLWW